MNTTTEQGNRKVELKADSKNSQDVSQSGNKVSGNDVPIYTEAQMKAKLSEQQSKIHTAEVQPLRDRNDKLERDVSSLNLQVGDLSGDKKVLEKQIAVMHGEYEKKIPADAKEVFNQYALGLAELTERETRAELELDKQRQTITPYLEREREELITSLVKDFHVDPNDCRRFKDNAQMKVWAYDHRKEAQADVPVEGDAQGNNNSTAAPDKAKEGQGGTPQVEQKPLSRPASPVNQGGTTQKTDSERLKSRYPSMGNIIE
jgi:hypothetical protein